MEQRSDSPARPQQRRQIELQQEQDDKALVLLAGGNHPVMMIYYLNDDILRLSHALLGVGHFRYGPLACKMLLSASELQPGNIKIMTAESVASSISCAQK